MLLTVYNTVKSLHDQEGEERLDVVLHDSLDNAKAWLSRNDVCALIFKVDGSGHYHHPEMDSGFTLRNNNDLIGTMLQSYLDKASSVCQPDA